MSTNVKSTSIINVFAPPSGSGVTYPYIYQIEEFLAGATYLINASNGAVTVNMAGTAFGQGPITFSRNPADVSSNAVLLVCPSGFTFPDSTTTMTLAEGVTQSFVVFNNIFIPIGAAAAATSIDILSPDAATGTVDHQKVEYLLVAASGSFTLANSAGFQSGQFYNPPMPGPGYVPEFSLEINPGNADVTCFQNSVITIVADGITVVSMPLQMYFMAISCAYVNDGTNTIPSFENRFLMMNCTQNDNTGEINLCSNFPIPYTASFSITITNGSSTNAMSVWSQCYFQLGVANTWPGTQQFNAAYTSILHGALADNLPEVYLNVAPGKAGRIAGYGFSKDPTQINGTVTSWQTALGTLEGNWLYYFDKTTFVWAATTLTPAASVLYDKNGNFQTSGSLGTTGGSLPNFSTTPGGTTTDGSVTWTCGLGDATTVRQNSTAYLATVHRFRRSEQPHASLHYARYVGGESSNMGDDKWRDDDGRHCGLDLLYGLYKGKCQH